MNTLIVGAGAVGGYFGALLARASRNVTFLVRPRRAEFLAARGLRIHTHEGVTIKVTPRTVTANTIDGTYDLILLTVKGYDLDQAINDFARSVGPHTVIVPCLNGMQHLDRLTDRFGVERVLGGVCHVATTLHPDGDVVQLQGPQKLAYGRLDGQPDPVLVRVHAALSGASFDARISLTIMQDMWEKWILFSTVGAITCLMRAPIRDVVASPGGETFALNVLDEATSIATAAGHPPRTECRVVSRAAINEAGFTSSSMYRDLTQGHAVEADSTLGDLVAHAHALGVPAPLLGLAYTNLSVYTCTRA